MRITLDTEKHTVEVHGAANYEELTHLVDTLVEHLAWPADTAQIVERIIADSQKDRVPFPHFDFPYQIFCNNTANPGATTI